MVPNEKVRYGRKLKVPLHASLDRLSRSSSREPLGLRAGSHEKETSDSTSFVGTLCLMPWQKCDTRTKPSRVMTMLRFILNLIPMSRMACKTMLAWPDYPSLGNRSVTGTLFGYKRGHVFLAVQEDPGAEPVLLLELGTPTSTLVREMASGLVRVSLECERTQNRGKLFLEPMWTMYCNGRKTGYAIRRSCSESDLHVLTLVQAISMGAGVLPKTAEEGPDGELMYMRAKFERVVGSKDSEAFYMMNPDGTWGPELSIFLLRI